MKALCALSLASFAALFAPRLASADTPLPTYQWADPALVHVAQPHAHASNIIYLDGCFGTGGCNITQGNEDSRTNRSSILSGHLTTFAFGQVTWAAVVDCVKKNYEPFDVTITDQDPGPTASYFKAIVAGDPNEVGMQGAGGVSPFSCGVIDNAITYTFANIYGGDVDTICAVVSQEAAHAFGLEHEYLCGDPMTYRQDCANRKYYNNVDAPCGEFSSRTCDCTGKPTQNSYRMIQDEFGVGKVSQPTVQIASPSEGENVPKGFGITVNSTSDVPLSKVEIYINNKKIAESSTPPFVFNAPKDVSNGNLIVEARAHNVYDAVTKTRVNVVRGAPCGGPDDCDATDVCVDGRCVLGPGNAGGLGETCTGNGQCASDLCGSDTSGSQLCAEQCKVGGGGCPAGFGCLDTGSFGVCWKGYDDGSGGGCQVGGNAGSVALFAVGLCLAGLAGFRRRRR